METELLGIIQGVDPPPVNDLPLAQCKSEEVQAEDADRVEPSFAGSALVEVTKAGEQPGQEGCLVGVAEGKWSSSHDRGRGSDRDRGAAGTTSTRTKGRPPDSIIPEGESPSPDRSRSSRQLAGTSEF